MGFFPRFNGAGFEPCVEVASPRVSVESIRYTSARWCVHGAAQIRRGKISGRKPSAARRDLRPTITLVPPPSFLRPHHHPCGPTITLVAPPSLLWPHRRSCGPTISQSAHRTAGFRFGRSVFVPPINRKLVL